RGHVILSAPPPQTGAQVIHTLKLLEPFELRSMGLPTQSARAFDVLVSAMRVAQADNRGNDDPRWRHVAAAGRITDAFAAQRRDMVGTGRAIPAVMAADATPHENTAPPAACAQYRPWPIDAPRAPSASGARAPVPEARPEMGET